MGRKPSGGHRNRQVSNQNLNPAAQPFIPGSGATATKPSTGKLNPSAPAFFPSTSESSVTEKSASTSVQSEKTASESGKPSAVDSVRETNNGLITIKLAVPSSEKKSSSDTSSPEKTESDGHLTDGGSSIISGSNSGENRTGVRASMTKAQQRKYNRKKKNHSLDNGITPNNQGGRGRNNRNDPTSTGSSSGGSGDKTIKDELDEPVFLSPNKSDGPANYRTPMKLQEEAEEHTSFTLTVPSLKKDLTSEHDDADKVKDLQAEIKDLQRKLQHTDVHLRSAEQVSHERDALKKTLQDMETKWLIHSETLKELSDLKAMVSTMEKQIQTYTAKLADVKDNEKKLLVENEALQRRVGEKDLQLEKAQVDQRKSGHFEELLTAASAETADLRRKLEESDARQKKIFSDRKAEQEFMCSRIKELELRVIEKESNREMEDMREDLLAKSIAIQHKDALLKELKEKNHSLADQVDGIKIHLVRMHEVERYSKDLENQLGEAAARLKEADSLRIENEKIQALNAEYFASLKRYEEQEKKMQETKAQSPNISDLEERDSASASATVVRFDGVPSTPSSPEREFEHSTGHMESPRERSPYRSGGGDRVAGSIWGAHSLSSSPQAKHNDQGPELKERRYVSTVAHMVTVNAAPDVITEHHSRAPSEETNGNLDPFGMPTFKGGPPGQDESAALLSAVNNEPETLRAEPVAPDATTDVSLLEPGTEVTGSSHQNGGGASDGKVVNGPSIVEPVRRKRRGCCAVQ